MTADANAIWYFYGPDEPIRCPNRVAGRLCDRAQDLAGPGTFVRVRLQPEAIDALASSLLRVCHRCKARLEVNVCPSTAGRRPVEVPSR